MISRSSGPVQSRMPTGAALVDPLRQVPHLGDPVGDLLPHQHAAAAGLRALADDHLDGVGSAQIVGIHSIARGQDLVDELARVLALLGQHAAVPCGRAGTHRAGATPERLLGGGREGAEAHSGDRDRDLEVDGLLGEARAHRDVRGAALPVALERVAGDACPEEEEIVEVRHAALRAEAPDVVDPLARHPVDLVDGVAVEEGRLSQPRSPAIDEFRVVGLLLAQGVELGHQYAPALSTWKL